MKNIFQNQSIKKAAAAGMIAAQVSIGSNFLSESFVDTSFAETDFYSSWNSSIFGDLVPDYAASSLNVSTIENTESESQKTRCVLDSDNVLSITPKAYSIDTGSAINNKISIGGSVGFANQIKYSSGPSLDGLYLGTATSTFSFGPNYNSDMSLALNLTTPDSGSIVQLTPNSFDYTPNPLPTSDYATGTYTASNGLGQTVNGVFVYNNYSGIKNARVSNVNYNEVFGPNTPSVNFGSNPAVNVVQSPANGSLINSFGAYYYIPNTNYVGQDFFIINNIDHYVSVINPTPTNGFVGGNFEIFSGSGGVYNPYFNPSIGNFKFYTPNLYTNLNSGSSYYLYRLEAPTTTFALPQLLSNFSSTSFIIDTLSSFYNDSFKTPVLEFLKQFTIVVEHDNRSPVVVPTAPVSFVVSGATGTVDLTSDYSDFERDTFNLAYEVSNDNFITVLTALEVNTINPVTNSTSSDSAQFTNLPIGTYSYRVIATEVNPTSNCVEYPNASFNKIASSTSLIRNFTISNAPLPVNLAPIAIPTSPANFVISGATGTIPLSSDYKDFEGDNFDLFYEVYEVSSSIPMFNEVYDIPDSVPNATSSHTSLGFDLSVGTYQYRLIAEDFSPTNNGGVPASSTSAFKSFVVSNTVVTPTSTPTTTPAVVTPPAPTAPQGGLLPLIPATPAPTLVASTTTPTTTEIKSPVKEVLGLNPEDGDDLLPGETPAAYLIRMEKRRVLGRSGSRDLLVETGYNSTLKIFAGVTLLAGIMLLLKNRKEKGEERKMV